MYLAQNTKAIGIARIGIWNCLFFKRGENQSTGLEKNLLNQGKSQENPETTYNTKSENCLPRLHWLRRVGRETYSHVRD